MRRTTLVPVFSVVHTLAACSGATRSPAGPVEACIPLAEAQTRAAAGAQRNEERYRKALEGNGLAPVPHPRGPRVQGPVRDRVRSRGRVGAVHRQASERQGLSTAP